MSIQANESDMSFVEKNRIESGIPSVPEDCGASEFPQECGLDDWVSYNKGCYLGQEVMARIQSMGSLRRSLRQISATEVLRGDIELKSPDTGKIVGTMKSFMGKKGLALVSIDCAEGTTLDSSIGPVLVGRLAKLPKYS
jgi:folate-binding protein YgfZ